MSTQHHRQSIRDIHPMDDYSDTTMSEQSSSPSTPFSMSAAKQGPSPSPATGTSTGTGTGTGSSQGPTMLKPSLITLQAEHDSERNDNGSGSGSGSGGKTRGIHGLGPGLTSGSGSGLGSVTGTGYGYGPRPVSPASTAAQNEAAAAISSVSRMMDHIRIETTEKQNDIDRLQELNEELMSKVTSTTSILEESQVELKHTKTELHTVTTKATQLDRALRAEQAAFFTLKDEMKLLREDMQKTKQENDDLFTRQANERNVRNELASELHKMQHEINVLEMEKSKFQHHFAEMEMKLRVEVDNFESERAQWKEKQMKFLDKIQNEERAIRAAQQTHSELQDEIKTLTERNTYLEHHLHAQQKQLQEMTREYNELRDTLKKVRGINEQLQSQSRDSNANYTNTVKELKQANNQLQLMADKVFQLMNRLQELDTWKQKAAAKQLEQQRKTEEYRNKYAFSQRKLTQEQRNTQKLQTNLKSLKARLTKTQKELNTVQANEKQARRQAKRLNRALKGKNSSVSSLTNKQQTLKSQLQTAKNEKLATTKVLLSLEQKVKQLKKQSSELSHRAKTLEAEKQIFLNAIERREKHLSLWQQKDQLFSQLKEAVASPEVGLQIIEALEDFERKVKTETLHEEDDTELIEKASKSTLAKGSGTHGDTVSSGSTAKGGRSMGTRSRSQPAISHSRSRSKKKKKSSVTSSSTTGHMDSRRIRASVSKLMHTSSGRQLLKVLNRMHVDRADVLRWSCSPAEFFKGLNTLTMKIREVDAAWKSNAAKDNEIQYLHQKNVSLTQRTEDMEEAKTKAVMRLATLVARSAPMLDRPAVTGFTAHNESDTTDLSKIAAKQKLKRERAKANPKKADLISESDNASVLQLTQNDIHDTEASYIASALRENAYIKEVDLRCNSIATAGLMSLVIACLPQKCAVEHIDLRNNAVTLGSLENLVQFLHQSSEVGGIVAASFSEERGRHLVPYVNVRTPHKTFAIDLRRNPVFAAGTMRTAKIEILSKLAARLEADDQQGRAPKVTVARDEMIGGPGNHEALDDDHHGVGMMFPGILPSTTARTRGSRSGATGSSNSPMNASSAQSSDDPKIIRDAANAAGHGYTDELASGSSDHKHDRQDGLSTTSTGITGSTSVASKPSLIMGWSSEVESSTGTDSRTTSASTGNARRRLMATFDKPRPAAYIHQQAAHSIANGRSRSKTRSRRKSVARNGSKRSMQTSSSTNKLPSYAAPRRNSTTKRKSHPSIAALSRSSSHASSTGSLPAAHASRHSSLHDKIRARAGPSKSKRSKSRRSITASDSQTSILRAPSTQTLQLNNWVGMRT
jgi:hypothetical protein